MTTKNIILNFDRSVKHTFNVVAVGKEKKPLAQWKNYQQRSQTEQEREEQRAFLKNNQASTIALINGIENLVAIDVDALDKTKPIAQNFIVSLLQKLNLPESYEWCWRSVSGAGWHIWVIVPDLPQDEKLRILTNETLRNNAFHNIDSIRAIEIRSRRLYTIIPPRVVIPETPPHKVYWSTLVSVFSLESRRVQEVTNNGKKEVTPRDRYYAFAALSKAAQRVANAPEGTRNNTLFAEVRNIGRFIESGALDKEEVIDMFAIASPLPERETMSTIESALNHAKERGPRYAPDGQQQQKEKEVKEGKNKAAFLVKLAQEYAEFFHDEQNNAYAKVKVNGHKEIKPLRSKEFKLSLFKLLHEKDITPPGSEVYNSALTMLESIALYDNPLCKVYLRVAPDEKGGFYIDLCNETWQAVHVTPQGWRVVDEPTVNFIRKKGMLPLPFPVKGSSFEEFRLFSNIQDEASWSLIKAWITASLMPDGPYPVLVLKGEQGCAKTTLARMLRSLVDPATPDLRRPPRDAEDLHIAASSCWVVALDNISYVSDWLSDDLCTLSTGGGHARRQLYTDDEEVLFSAQRPILLNGITDFIHRDDLLDRAIIVELHRIPENERRDEKTLWAEFEERRPRLFGALLDRLVGALRERSTIKLSVLPRMADFAITAAAAEKYEVSGNWSEETSLFLQSYREAREEAHESAIEASVVGVVLMQWLASTILPWQGGAAELLDILTNHANERQLKAPGWPKTVNNLGSTLRRIAPALRSVGYNIDFTRSNGVRKLCITQS